PKKNFPYVSLVVLGVIAIVCSFFSLSMVIDALITTRILIQFIGQIAAVTLLRRNAPELKRPYRIWLYPLPNLLALAGWMFVFATTDWTIIAFGLGTLFNRMSKLTEQELDQFNRDGYLMKPALFDVEEMELLITVAKNDQRLEREALERRDAQAGTSKLWLTDVLEDDIYSAFVRCVRIVDPLEQILGGEVYHYHHKMMLKEPFVGGSWEWHQDYGYWYSNRCLFPYMASCLIAVDRANRDNGCLQVIRGSHLMGRIDHNKTGDQTGADMDRVNEALKYLELVYCEMEP